MSTENLLNVLPTEIAASAELTHAQKKVLGQLIVYSGLNEAKENDGWFFRSNEDLCNDVEVSNNTLLASVRKLYNLGYIDRKAGSRTTGASEYKVLFDCTHNCTQIEPLIAPIAPLNCTHNCTKIEPLIAPIAPLNCTHNCTQIEPLIAPIAPLNCTHTLDDIYLVMSEILIELKRIGSIKGSVDCTNNCGDMGANSPVNSGIAPIAPLNCTPDTDTDKTTISTTDETYSTYCKGGDGKTEPNSSDSNEVGFDNVDTTPDNRKFSEQYDRIQRAIWEVKTNNTPENIKTMQRVMEDAVEKARMYATEKQHNLIDRRIDDFQKEAYGSACTPKWIEDLPDYLDNDQVDPAMIKYFQDVDDKLSKIPDQDKRSRSMEICLQKAVQTYSRPYAEFHGRDIQKAARIVAGNFEHFFASKKTNEQTA